jgi:hypothetical protein
MYLEEGESLFGVSRKLKARGIPSPRGRKIWTVSTLRGILTNPIYTGRIYAGRMSYRPPRIRRSATHPIGRSHDTGVSVPPEEWTFVSSAPSIVSQEHFELVQEKLSKNKSFARRNNKNNTYLLRALVSCGRCELSCIARTVNRKNKYYVCSGKGKQIHTGREKKCPSRFAPADQLDELVWKDLCEVLTPYPSPEHHRSPPAGARRTLATPRAQSEAREHPGWTSRPQAPIGEAHGSIPRGDNPAGGVRTQTARSRAKRTSIGISGEATTDSS